MTTIAIHARRGRHHKPSAWTRLQAWLDREVVANRILTVVATTGATIITAIIGGVV